EVPPHEQRLDPPPPPVAPPLGGARAAVDADEAPLGLLEEGDARGVAQRPHDAGDVDERRLLDAALADRPRRLALEVDDDHVAAGPEHLAEVEVAVHPGPARVDPVVAHAGEALDQAGLEADETLEVGGHV